MGRVWRRQTVVPPIVEWALVVTALVVLCWVFLRQLREIQAQAEMASMVGTVGNLRSAFALSYLRGLTHGSSDKLAVKEKNPFLLLERIPINYRGDMTKSAAYALEPGGWVFVADCVCVGYQPKYGQWLSSPSEDSIIWLKVSFAQPPFGLEYQENYLWHDQPVGAGMPY